MGVYLHAGSKPHNRRALLCLLAGVNPAEADEVFTVLGWFDALWPVLREAGPIVSLIDGYSERADYVLHLIQQAMPDVYSLSNWELSGFGRVGNWWNQSKHDTVGSTEDQDEITAILSTQGVKLPQGARELITSLYWG